MMNSEISVSQIMTSHPVSVESDARLHKIRQIFEQYDFHHIPVLESDKLVGILSRTDFYKVSHTLFFSFDGKEHVEPGTHCLTARDIMTKYPVHLDPDDTIGLVADIILANKFHALPVVDNGDLVGILTSHDLIAYAYGSTLQNDVSIDVYEDFG